MEANQMTDQLTNLCNLYLDNIILVVIIEELIAFGLFAYYMIHRRRHIYFHSYWRGFLFIGLGISVTLFQVLFSFQSWKFNLIKLPLLCIGLFWIFQGIKIQRQEKKRTHDEK